MEDTAALRPQHGGGGDAGGGAASRVATTVPEDGPLLSGPPGVGGGVSRRQSPTPVVSPSSSSATKGLAHQHGSSAGSRNFSSLAQTLQRAVDDSSTVFHVFQAEPIGLNLAVFELWLKGLREEQVVYFRRNLLGEETRVAEGELLLLLFRDAIDQYRMFQLLEDSLVQPLSFTRQPLVQVSPRVQVFMIAKYYEFDDEVVRELLGRKLSTRARKDLDEVAETSNVLLPSCRRQFDNLRRLYIALDERNFEGNITGFIADQFRIPWKLAERYTCILFLLNNRFHLTTRKKTAFIKLFDLEYCAAMVILHWVAEASGAYVQYFGPRQFAGSQYVSGGVPGRAGSASPPPVLSASPGQARLSPTSSLSDAGALAVEGTTALGDDDGDQEDSDENDEFGELEDEPDDDEVVPDDEPDGIPGPGRLALGIPPPLPQHSSSSPSMLPGTASPKLEAPAPHPPAKGAIFDDPAAIIAQLPAPGNTSMDISPSLIARWRTIKSLLLGNRGVLDSTIRKILLMVNNRLPSEQKHLVQALRGRFKGWVKALLSIGAGLAQAKELRDLFEDTLELLCEPLFQQVGLPLQGVQVVLECTHQAFGELDMMRKRNLETDWERFMRVEGLIVLRLCQALGDSTG